MRIALVNSYYAPDRIGGAEAFVELLAHTFLCLGHEVRVFCTGRENREAQLSGITVCRQENHNIYWPPDREAPPRYQRTLWHLRDCHNRAAACQLANMMRSFQPDLIHLHNISGFSPAIYGALNRMLPGRPIIQTLQDYYHACPRKTLLRGNGTVCARRHVVCALRGAWMKQLARQVTLFIAPSNFIAHHLDRMGIIPLVKTDIIPNAVANPSVRPEEIRDHRLKRDGEPLHVLYLGQLAKHKGLGTLVAAADRLAARNDVVFTVAGDGPLRASIEAKSNITYLGLLTGKGKEEALLAADVLLIPSEWYENLPLAVLEGMSYGLAIIGTSIGGIPELVTDGWNGRLFPPQAHAQLAHIISEAASRPNLRTIWQLNSLERSTQYNLEGIAGRHIQLYEKSLWSNGD